AEPVGQSVQATELVHEAFLRLTKGEPVAWDNRRHFFAAAAEAMRRVLIDRARSRRTRRRGHGLLLRPPSDQAFHDVISPVDDSVLDPLELDRAVEILETIAPRPALVVKLRYFLGLTIEDTAHVLHLGLTTVKSDWFFARAWLHRFFADDGDEDVPC
ncbi:MAG: RNA polymerase subunit sigma, partial [Candidatus Eisenbacteria bacterium]|nr:RNA polymerase subunit sigma [Candidatus Eisenbacteria bacterium]